MQQGRTREVGNTSRQNRHRPKQKVIILIFIQLPSKNLNRQRKQMNYKTVQIYPSLRNVFNPLVLNFGSLKYFLVMKEISHVDVIVSYVVKKFFHTKLFNISSGKLR
jgi:hypothetical protein